MNYPLHFDIFISIASFVIKVKPTANEMKLLTLFTYIAKKIISRIFAMIYWYAPPYGPN